MQRVWRVSDDILGKAIASATGQRAWAWLVLTASPVPRWAKYPRFLVWSGFRYTGFELATNLLSMGVGDGRAGPRHCSLPMNAWSLQASHRKGGCCKTVDFVSLPRTEKLEAPCRPGVASMLRVRPIVLSPAAMRLTCESPNNRLQQLRPAIYAGLDL